MFPTRERVINCQNYTFCYSYFITSRSNYLFHSATKRKFHWQDGSRASAAFLGNQSWKYDRHIVEPLFWNTVDPSLSLCWDTLGSRFAFCYEAVRHYGSTLPLFNGSLSLSGRFAYDLSPLAAGHYVELLCSVVQPYLLQVRVLVWMVRRFGYTPHHFIDIYHAFDLLGYIVCFKVSLQGHSVMFDQGMSWFENNYFSKKTHDLRNLQKNACLSMIFLLSSRTVIKTTVTHMLNPYIIIPNKVAKPTL